MDPLTAALMFGSAALSAKATNDAGVGAELSSQLNAYGIATEDELNKAQAIQMSNSRFEDYRLATATNEAAFAAMGRDIGSDPSVNAFMRRQREIASKDADRIQSQSRLQTLQSRQRAAAEITEGKAARRASKIQATQTLLKAGYQYQTTR